MPIPPGFIPHVYDTTLPVPRPRPAVWAWLNNPDTFVKGQLWPYRVEFLPNSGDPDDQGNATSGFAKGVLNIHHGPFLHLPGRIGEVDPGTDGQGHHRDLIYTYGAYAIAWTAVRPTRLAFWLTDPDDPSKTHTACNLRVRVEAHCKPRIAAFWNASQNLFWKRFFKWTARAIPQHPNAHTE